MKIRVNGDRIIVRLHQASKSDGYGQTDLIDIPENCEKVFKFCGQVIGIGPKADPDIRLNQYIVFGTYSQLILQMDASSQEYAIVKSEDVDCVLLERPEYLSVVPGKARWLAEVA